MKKNRQSKRIFKELAPYMNLGLQMALTITLCSLLGWWLDSKFDTKPILILVFSFLGVIIGMYSFFKTVFDLEKKKKKKTSDRTKNERNY